MIGVNLEGSLVEVLSLLNIDGAAQLLQFTKLVQAVRIVRVVLQRHLEVSLRHLVVPVVVESSRQVKVTLRGVRVQLESQLVRIDRLLKVTLHVVCVTKVVQGRSVIVVEKDSALVCCDSLIMLLKNAVSISKVVE